MARDRGVRHVILAMSEIPRETLRTFFEECGDSFSDVIVIPDLAGFSSLWAEPRDLRGTLGLEIQQKLLIPRARVLKRILDILLVVAFSVVVLPLIAVIAGLIKLTSPRAGFFRAAALWSQGRAVHGVEIPFHGCRREPGAGTVSGVRSGAARRMAEEPQAQE